METHQVLKEPYFTEQGSFVIVGLGNPGEEYKDTRHNVGFMVADELAGRWNISFKKWRGIALLTETKVAKHKIFLVKPITFMNLSGDAVTAILSYYKQKPDNLLVISDDVNLSLGVFRMRIRGGDGGHNGLASIIESIGTTQFPRLRVGTKGSEDSLPEDLSPYVLGKFAGSERLKLREIIEKASDAVECFLEQGIDIAMSRFNG